MHATITGPAATFAHNMQRLRDHNGLSQQKLADALARLGIPISQAAIWKIEHGKKHLRLVEAVAIARVLGSSVDDMVRPAGTDTGDQAGYWRARAIRAENRLRSIADVLNGASS